MPCAVCVTGYRKRSRALLKEAKVLPTRSDEAKETTTPAPTPAPTPATEYQYHGRRGRYDHHHRNTWDNANADTDAGAHANADAETTVAARTTSRQEGGEAHHADLQACHKEKDILDNNLSSMQSEIARLRTELAKLGWKDPVGAWIGTVTLAVHCACGVLCCLPPVPVSATVPVFLKMIFC